MKIGIDCRWIFGHISGIGRYTSELVEAMLEADSGHEYVLYFDRQETLEQFLSFKGEKISYCLLNYGPFSVRGFFALPRQIKKDGLDVFFSPNFMIPLLCRDTKLVCTVHDLIPLIHPEFVPRSLKARLRPVYKLLMGFIASRADRIIAVSDRTRDDIITHLEIDPERVVRIYNGFTRRVDAAGAKGTLPFASLLKSRSVVLYVGRWEPYKNLQGLIRAFKIVLSKAPETILVIAGSKDKRYPEIMKMIHEDKQLDERVIITGYVNDNMLALLYRSADLFVQPSYYEGFGLGILEAFSNNIPVAASCVASIPEVAGGGAQYFDPSKDEDIAAQILTVIKSDETACALVHRGHGMLKRFSWKKTALAVTDLFESLEPKKKN